MSEIVNFDVLNEVEEFALRRSKFHSSTCYDYIDSLLEYDGRYGVCIFVEPCGNITKWADSWLDALLWWKKVFETQPKEMDYIDAGWHLFFLSEQELPDDAENVWTANIKDGKEQWDRSWKVALAELKKRLSSERKPSD